MPIKILWRSVGALLVLSLLLGFLCAPVGAVESGKGGKVGLFLHEAEAEDGIIVLDLELSSEMGVCAMLCELDYNPNALIYLSGGACDDSVNLAALDLGGTVRFLMDTAANSTDQGDLARFYFKRIGSGSAGFALKCRNALYLYDGEIAQANVEILMPDIEEKEESAENDKDEEAPEITDIELKDGVIFFSVNVGYDCFAAGARLFFVDLSGCGGHFEALIAGVVKGDGVLDGEYRFCPDKSYAVVITAQGYCGKQTVIGEKITLLYPRQN